MFEIIQSDYGVLRFDDDYYYEQDGDHVKVYTEKSDFIELITTVFRPIRVDTVDIDCHLLAPILTLRASVLCKHCGKEN